jgi:glycosyltransferase involved in cell wall biosynthesis
VGNVEDRKKASRTCCGARAHAQQGASDHRRRRGAQPALCPGWIDRFGINDRITFTGKISTERLVELYSEHEIAVCPSLYEGFGFPAGEAMACELPVIAARGGALPEVVGEHMKTTYLVPPRPGSDRGGDRLPRRAPEERARWAGRAPEDRGHVHLGRFGQGNGEGVPEVIRAYR